jgi:acyl-CoA synthetase (NDP forming)
VREITGAEADLARLFAPRSIAVIGASSRPGALSWWPLRLLGRYPFEGPVYPINPNRAEIDGVRCYPSLGDVPGPVDLAIVALSAERTIQAVRDCADAGVKGVVLPTQGLGETGEDGRRQELELVEYARERGLRVIGPNTDGMANLATGAMATIQPLLDRVIQPGPVAVVSQSGATAGSLLVRLQRAGIGCRYYAAAGNESDLGLADYLSFVLQDPEVRIVLSFVEAIRRPDDFVKVAALAAELGKPIALIKVGRSEQGAKRAAAHTGALAGADELYDALFRAHGIVRVAELGELVATAKLYLAGGGPASRGVGIVSVSGGQAGAIADRAIEMGLEVPGLDPAAEAELDELLTFGNGLNPCDLTGEVAVRSELAASVYGTFDGQTGLATVVYGRKGLTGTAGSDAAVQLVAAAGRPGATPLAVYAMDGVVEGLEGEIYEQAGVPTFDSLHELFVAVAGLADHAAFLARGRSPQAARNGRPSAPLDLAAYGIPLPREILTHTAAEAVGAAEEIGYPVVLKVVSERILHKTEAGGVELGLRSAEAVGAAFERIDESGRRHLGGDEIDGVLVQEQVEGGVELIAGVKVDPAFGPFVLVGLGGVFTEVLKDVSLRPAPVDPAEARAMIEELRGAPLLHGYRTGEPMDIDAVALAVSNLSRLAAEHADELDEIDLNPLIALPHGVRAADTLVVLRT